MNIAQGLTVYKHANETCKTRPLRTGQEVLSVNESITTGTPVVTERQKEIEYGA